MDNKEELKNKLKELESNLTRDKKILNYKDNSVKTVLKKLNQIELKHTKEKH